MKLETNFKEKKQKQSNSSTLNNTLLNNEWINNDIKEEIKKFLETNENEHTTTPKLWDTQESVLREKFIGIQAYLKKIKKFQINLTLHLQKLEE